MPNKNQHYFLRNRYSIAVFVLLNVACLICIALVVARIAYSDTSRHRGLIWNLFLAWIPFMLAYFAHAVSWRRTTLYLIIPVIAFLWLIFFPNAPYIVTDFLHLEDRPQVPMWYDILMLATFAWTGCFLAIASLRTMQLIVKSYVGWFASWLFAGVALSLCGLGIYLGRFSRWNTWDLFSSPKAILRELATNVINPFSNLQFTGFTILFTAFLVVCYLTFMSISKESELLH